jgi:hypothetical protein
MTRRPDQYASKVREVILGFWIIECPGFRLVLKRVSGAELVRLLSFNCTAVLEPGGDKPAPKSPCSPDAARTSVGQWTPRYTRVKPTRSARKVATASRYSFMRRRFCTLARSTPSVS